MAVSKVVYKASPNATPVIWMDATSATASASDIISPKTAMIANGVMTTGTGAASTTLHGTFTCPSSGSSYEFAIGRTISKYMFIFELTDASKTALINTSATTAKTYAFIGVHPKTSINNVTCNYQTIALRYKPSTATVDSGAPSANFVYTDTSITMPLGAFTAGAHYLYRDCTYNYSIVEYL